MRAVSTKTVAVIGAGSWGTALAILLASNHSRVHLWAHRQAHADKINAERCNSRYLPDISLPDNLQATADLEAALTDIDLVLLVVPSHAFRDTLRAIKPFMDGHKHLAWGSKGLEPETNKLLHEICKEEMGEGIVPVVVTGPTFAAEVARGLPSAVTVACEDEHYAEQVARMLHNEVFRAYISPILLVRRLVVR